MDADELKQRTKKFGLVAIHLVESLPYSQTNKVIGNQLLRSALSVGANYRAACRARSKPDFISKIGIVIEETDGNRCLIRTNPDQEPNQQSEINNQQF